MSSGRMATNKHSREREGKGEEERKREREKERERGERWVGQKSKKVRAKETD